MTAPSPPRRSGASSSRRYASPAATSSRARPRASSAVRSTAAAGSSSRLGSRPEPPPARPAGGYARAHAGGLTFTTRAALLGLALCAVVLTLAYPAREYLAQHRQINQLAQQVAKDKANVSALQAAGLRDADPAYVESEARLRLHMQRPGDQVFLLPPVVVNQPGKQTAGAVRTPVLPGRSTQPWYSQLYRSTVESGK